MELVKLKGADFGIEETKAQQISAQFKPMLDKMVELEKEYNKVMKLPKNKPETAEKAGELRKKLVKVRTGTNEIHKAQKAFYLAGGRFVDAWKNAQLFASQGLEEKLLEIETYQQRLEAEKVENLRIEREEALRPYHDDFAGLNLGAMQMDVWEAYFDKKKRDWEDLEKAKEEAEAKRLEEARLNHRLVERTQKLSPLIEFFWWIEEPDFKVMEEEEFAIIYERLLGMKTRSETIKALKENRERALLAYSQHVNFEGLDLGNMSQKEFDKIYNEAKEKAEEYAKKLKLQQEENARLQAEAKAKEEQRLKELEAERKKREEAEAKARAEAEAKERERLAQLEEERKKREALEAELKEKREKEEAEAKAKAQAEALAKAEAEKLAKAGDKKRVLAWIETFEALPQLPEGKPMKDGPTALVENIKAKFEGFKKWAKEEAEKL